MTDYIGREVALDRLRKACKAGTIASVLLLLTGLFHAGIAALIFTNVKLPDFVWSVLYVVVPTMSNTTLAFAECVTKAILFVLMGIIALLMFGKMSKTGDAFRTGQLKQMRFISILVILLGFLPTLVGNGFMIAEAIRKGGSPMAVMSFAVNGMCVIAGLLMFFVTRVLVAGGVVKDQGDLPAPAPAPAYDVPATTGAFEAQPSTTSNVYDLTKTMASEPTTSETTSTEL